MAPSCLADLLVRFMADTAKSMVQRAKIVLLTVNGHGHRQGQDGDLALQERFGQEGVSGLWRRSSLSLLRRNRTILLDEKGSNATPSDASDLKHQLKAT
jgi:hypothetical protein